MHKRKLHDSPHLTHGLGRVYLTPPYILDRVGLGES